MPVTRACQECGRLLLPMRGHDLIEADGRARTLCELCAKPTVGASAVAHFVGGSDAQPVAPREPEPMEAIHRLSHLLDDVARAAADIARGAGAAGAWRLRVDQAEEEAIRCLRAVEAAGDALTQGDPERDGMPAVARAARAAADALDAAAAAVKSADAKRQP